MHTRTTMVVIGLGTLTAGALAGNTRNIMLTGYWPPTNEMLRQFSTNPKQNPDGWQGANWEGRGYNIYSFFPEFEGGTGVNSKGNGDFEVDYQDTTADWWRITDQIDPVALITFSWTSGRASHGRRDWEIEDRNRNRASWTNDYQQPFKPDQSPPDSGYETNGLRFSTLPMAEIRDAVNDSGVGVSSYIDSGAGGTFLSEFIGYHGLWYQSLHSDPNDPHRAYAAGHIHVGSETTIEQGRLASEVTLRVLTNYLDSVPTPGTLAPMLMTLAGLARRRRV